MAEEGAFGSAIERMMHEVALKLTPYGGRVFVEHADFARLDHCQLEIKCWVSPELFGMGVTIGDEVHTHVKQYKDEDQGREESEEVEMESGWRLSDVPVMLTFYRVDDAWLRKSADEHGGKPLLGQLNYYPRINTDDGVVNDKRPTITAWMSLGPDNFELVRQRLLDFKKFDFEIGLTVEFPKGSVINEGFIGRTIKWDGAEMLPVKSGAIVWRKEDWSADFHRREYLVEKEQPKAEAPYDPPREHLELLSASQRIEGAVAKLLTPLWLLAAAVIAYIIFRR